jgi:hypothetical protein
MHWVATRVGVTPISVSLARLCPMPIIVEEGPEPMPLRGYTIYASELPTIAEQIGKDAQMVYWRDGARAAFEANDPRSLTHSAVSGFAVSGGKVTFTVERLSKRFHSRWCTVTVSGEDMRSALGVVETLTPRRFPVLPWTAYYCRFVPKDRDDHRGWNVALIALVVGVLGLLTGLLTTLR